LRHEVWTAENGGVSPLIANQAELGSIRTDVEGEMTAAGIAKTLGDKAKPIP